jgi:hypothetical protein
MALLCTTLALYIPLELYSQGDRPAYVLLITTDVCFSDFMSETGAAVGLMSGSPDGAKRNVGKNQHSEQETN